MYQKMVAAIVMTAIQRSGHSCLSNLRSHVELYEDDLNELYRKHSCSESYYTMGSFDRLRKWIHHCDAKGLLTIDRDGKGNPTRPLSWKITERNKQNLRKHYAREMVIVSGKLKG